MIAQAIKTAGITSAQSILRHETTAENAPLSTPHTMKSEHDAHDEALSLYMQGSDCYKRGQFSEALDHLMTSQELHPHYKTLQMISQCYTQMGDAQHSAAYIQQAYEHAPHQDSVCVAYAGVLLKHQQCDKARSILEATLVKKPQL